MQIEYACCLALQFTSLWQLEQLSEQVIKYNCSPLKGQDKPTIASYSIFCDPTQNEYGGDKLSKKKKDSYGSLIEGYKS